ncbi:anti-repressor SinI family protein [Fictibacillus arsenicus]|nr:anti-repressor SinI family protein [Fictibacillus arsenicus]
MDSKTIEKVDEEWVRLIQEAKEQGLSMEDVRIFFAAEKVDWEV